MLEQENFQIACLAQAMLGAISPNFRMVALQLTHDSVMLHFLLEEDDQDDRDEIDDILLKFEALQPGPIAVRVAIAVDARPFSEIGFSGRVVYMRKEA